MVYVLSWSFRLFGHHLDHLGTIAYCIMATLTVATTLAPWTPFWPSEHHFGYLGTNLAICASFGLSGRYFGSLDIILALWAPSWLPGHHLGSLGTILAIWAPSPLSGCHSKTFCGICIKVPEAASLVLVVCFFLSLTMPKNGTLIQTANSKQPTTN